ncbi:MAG: SMC family ATPase [Armatimonadetes bacterium]|nr:SMC family ATPase [Armatimonadota bacterium]
MIPIRLELKNFMSYGENVMPLDLTGIHLACLCGDNGNGKSAILDAITWALWDKARAGSDELIRAGRTEMRVTFDFELNQDLYRVIRGRGKRASANLWEVQIAEDPGAGLSETRWRSLTGQGKRETEDQITRILRMDYKTFINSAYIQQGRADEFTRQSSHERKKILADILDLSRYNILEQKAKDRRNDADRRAGELAREIEQSESELVHEDEWKSQLTGAKTERESLEVNLSKAEEQVRDLQRRQADLDAKSKRIKQVEAQVVSVQSELRSLDSQRIDQERRVACGREVLADKERIIKGVKSLNETRERIVKLDGLLDELRKLEHEMGRLEQAVSAEKHKLETERDSVSRELADLKVRLDKAEVATKDIEPLREQVAKLDEAAARLTALQAEISSAGEQFGRLETENAQLKESLADLTEKLGLISQPGAECPLCKTELSHEKHESVIADYRRRIEETEAAQKRTWAEGAEAKRRRDSAHAEMKSLDATLKAGLDVRNRLAQAEQVAADAAEARKGEPRLRERLAEIAKKLDSEDYALGIRAQSKDIESRMAGLNYDEKEHGALRSSLADLQEFEARAAALKTAEENLPADESNLEGTVALIAARRKAIADSEQEIRELQAAAADLPAVASELPQASAVVGALRESDRELTGRIARLEQSVERCRTLRKQTAVRRKELEQAKREKAVYADLVVAFGKKGVQALIIENATPEIQNEANELLARMTDNSMQISFETVQDKTAGGIKETLEIKVSDDMGTRSYELYSGGEAFRVNFAIRIALSKMLARRAGAALQALIIDEGFGTQDGKGREKLVEAIDSIKDDFEKILVITHIDELKDAFPTRIEITKDSQGSQIAVG